MDFKYLDANKNVQATDKHEMQTRHTSKLYYLLGRNFIIARTTESKESNQGFTSCVQIDTRVWQR